MVMFHCIQHVQIYMGHRDTQVISKIHRYGNYLCYTAVSKDYELPCMCLGYCIVHEEIFQGEMPSV